MTKLDTKMRRLVWGALLWIGVICFILFWMHCYFDYREARREMIYKKARALAEQEQRQRARNYQLRMEQDRLNKEYNQGHVIGRQ